MDQTTSPETLNDEATECPIAARIKIDYEELMADTEPDQPGGRIVWSSDDYATEEEEDAAFEAFIKEIMERPYEEK